MQFIDLLLLFKNITFLSDLHGNEYIHLIYDENSAKLVSRKQDQWHVFHLFQQNDGVRLIVIHPTFQVTPEEIISCRQFRTSWRPRNVSKSRN